MTADRKHILTWLGLVLALPIAGPYVLNSIFFRPPPRPSVVPGDALPFQQGAESKWWWASCRELDATSYQCRLYDESGGLAVAGKFVAEPRRWGDNGENEGQCKPGSGRRPFNGYYNGEISMKLYGGCVLAPREWTYFPARRSKAAASQSHGSTSLAREVAMTPDEIQQYAR